MKLFIFCLPLWLACLSCGADQSGQTTQEPNRALPASQPQTVKADVIAYSPLEVVIQATSAKVAKGAGVCLPVTVANFKEIIGLQFSMKWDKKLLNFQEVKNFNLPKMGPANFGAHRSSEGILTFLWLDEMLKGASLKDAETLFELCFVAKGNPGQSSAIEITGEPTAIEVINARDQLLNLKAVKGSVTIE